MPSSLLLFSIFSSPPLSPSSVANTNTHDGRAQPKLSLPLLHVLLPHTHTHTHKRQLHIHTHRCVHSLPTTGSPLLPTQADCPLRERRPIRTHTHPHFQNDYGQRQEQHKPNILLTTHSMQYITYTHTHTHTQVASPLSDTSSNHGRTQDFRQCSVSSSSIRMQNECYVPTYVCVDDESYVQPEGKAPLHLSPTPMCIKRPMLYCTYHHPSLGAGLVPPHQLHTHTRTNLSFPSPHSATNQQKQTDSSAWPASKTAPSSPATPTTLSST